MKKQDSLVLRILLFVFITALLNLNCSRQVDSQPQMVNADVCIYTATASGILAAVAVSKQGKSVVIIEPGRWVGGILGAGIKPTQDCPNIEATGGMTRPLLESLGVRDGNQTRRDISPKNIREDFLKLINEHKINIIYEHRITRCVLENGRISEAFFDLAPYDQTGCPPENPEKHENLSVKAKVFIDASYDGELMYYSGVSFRTGRESSSDYDEKTAGVQNPTKLTPIDPFIEPGNPESGILNLVEADHGKPFGTGDHYTQAYNFRYYVTSDSAHRVAIEPPENYDPQDFELVGRYVAYLTEITKNKESLFRQLSWIFPGWMNDGEYNYQRRSLITMAPVGISHRYATGDWATKAVIWKQHMDYLRGLHHFLSTDSRVPVGFREMTGKLGFDKRHHEETNGRPHQLYIRVSRRLIGRYTITEHDVYNRTQVNDPIGLAQYGIDTYPSRRIWLEQDGQIYVALEGEMFIGGDKGPTNVPYPIPYRAITPLKHECTNLLVPVCFSATHVGYSSARMEPVFMICGESSGLAAVQAIDEDVAVQDINMERYQKKLKEAKQVLGL